MQYESDRNRKTEDSGGLVQDVVMRCSNCGYTQRDAEIQGDHRLCKNQNPPWRKYFRAQAQPLESCSMAYWVEYADGKKASVTVDRIPDGAVVSDITFDDFVRDVKKSGRSFVDA